VGRAGDTRGACRAFLDICQEIENRYGHGLVGAGVEAAVDAGLVESQPVGPLADVLFDPAGGFLAYLPGRTATRIPASCSRSTYALSSS
jgi:hypothetical protein